LGNQIAKSLEGFMRTKILGLVWLTLLVLSAQPGLAQTDIISRNTHFTGDAGLDLWDLSGHYSESMGGVDMDLTLSMDSKGKITGSGTASLAEYGMDMNFRFTGAVKKSGNLTRVVLNLKAKGNLVVEGKSYGYTVSGKANLAIDPQERVMTGAMKITASAGGHSESEKTQETWALPPGVNGGWDLSVSGTAQGKSLTGNGTVTLASGKEYNLNLQATSSPKTGLYQAKLTGQGEAKGISMSVIADQTFVIKSLNGKVCGQTIKGNGGG
jgi:hypothetical protein